MIIPIDHSDYYDNSPTPMDFPSRGCVGYTSKDYGIVGRSGTSGFWGCSGYSGGPSLNDYKKRGSTNIDEIIINNDEKLKMPLLVKILFFISLFGLALAIVGAFIS